MHKKFNYYICEENTMEYTCESIKAFIQNRSKYTYVHVYIDILMSFEFYIHASKSRYVVFSYITRNEL